MSRNVIWGDGQSRGPGNSAWRRMDLSAGLQTVRDENKTGKVRAARELSQRTHISARLCCILRLWPSSRGYESGFAFAKRRLYWILFPGLLSLDNIVKLVLVPKFGV